MGPEDRIVSWDFPDDDKDYTDKSSDKSSSLVSMLEKVEKKGTSIRFTLPEDEMPASPVDKTESSIDSASILSLPASTSTFESNKNAPASQALKVQKGRFSIVEGGSSPAETTLLSMSQSNIESQKEKEEPGNPTVSTCNFSNYNK